MSKANQLAKAEKINQGLKLTMVVLFLVGLGIFSYPFVVDALNNYLDQQRLTEMQRNFDEQQAAKKKAELVEENKQIVKGTHIPGMGQVADPFAENIGSNVTPDVEAYYQEHAIGAVYIPKIKVSLPLFDVTNDRLLERGVTVLQGSSFPVGGSGTHAVLTGHTGLPDKKLFTDLEQLVTGDPFYLEVLGDKFAYKVIAIKTVLPNQIEALKIEAKQELVTLLTCTPYMVNSHRLLVTGERTSYPPSVQKAINQTQDYHKRRLFLLIGIIGSIVFLCLGWFKNIIKLILSRKHTYDVCFKVTFQKQPVKGLPVMLFDYKKQPLKQVAFSDEGGQVIFKNLPGNRYYCQLASEKRPTLKASVGKLKSTHLVLKGRQVARDGNHNYVVALVGRGRHEKVT